MRNILIRPIISEKMDRQVEKLGKYGFFVDVKANKIQIKNAIEDMYGVTVESVNTIIMPRKNKFRYTRSGILRGKTKLVKKAIVTLEEGDQINFYESV